MDSDPVERNNNWVGEGDSPVHANAPLCSLLKGTNSSPLPGDPQHGVTIQTAEKMTKRVGVECTPFWAVLDVLCTLLKDATPSSFPAGLRNGWFGQA